MRFAVNDQFAHEGAGIAAGVAHLHPAGRFSADAKGGNVFVVFAGVVPPVVGEEVAARNIKFKCDGDRSHHAFEFVHARSGVKRIGGVAVGPHAPHQLGIARTGRIADPG